MGLFSGIKDNWKKSEAAAIIQSLLENSQKNMGTFGFSHDPAQAATSLVQNAWEAIPDVFSGKFGQRPHKLTTAAIALAYGVQHTTNEDNQSQFLIALGNILNQVEVNGSFYPFNSTDNYLLVRASEVFTNKANAPNPYDDLLASKKNSDLTDSIIPTTRADQEVFEYLANSLASFKVCQELFFTHGGATKITFADGKQKLRYLYFMLGAVDKLSNIIGNKPIRNTWAMGTMLSEASLLYAHADAMLHLENYGCNQDNEFSLSGRKGWGAMCTFLVAGDEGQDKEEFIQSTLEMYAVVNQIPQKEVCKVSQKEVYKVPYPSI